MRLEILIVGLLYTLPFIYSLKLSNDHLGLTFKNFIPALLALTPFLLAGFFLILAMYSLDPNLIIFNQMNTLTQLHFLPLPFIYLLLAVPLQIFIFFSYYLNRLKFIYSNSTSIIIGATFFSLIHFHFENKLILLFTFILGVLYSWHFYRFKSFPTLVVSHALFGSLILFLAL